MSNLAAAPRPTAAGTPLPAWRRQLWLAILVLASVAFSLGFACVAPFAAFAAAAALTHTRRDALALMAGVWLANQIVGFALLDYPWTANAVGWGAVFAAAAALATLAAHAVATRGAGLGQAATAGLAFVAAYAAYEGVLIAAAATVLGGTADDSPAIIAQVGALNFAAYLGLFVLERIGTAIGLSGTTFPRRAAARPA